MAKKIAQERDKLGYCPSLFIQINSGEESQKSGILPQDFESFYNYCRDLDLPITGVMNLPPVDQHVAPHFALCQRLADRYNLTHKSMGMSHDYHHAIMLGSTMIRLGTALFGQRPIPVSTSPVSTSDSMPSLPCTDTAS